MYYPHAEKPTIQTQDSWLSHLLLLWTNIQIIEREREREYKKVQACLGLETFTANFLPSWGFFQACSVGLTDPYKPHNTQINNTPSIYLSVHGVLFSLCCGVQISVCCLFYFLQCTTRQISFF